MPWEFMRDLGLDIFAAGALVTFGIIRIAHLHLDRASVALMATIGDTMMLGGACLAVIAMMIGFLVLSASPS
jgi:hypothetical protein